MANVKLPSPDVAQGAPRPLPLAEPVEMAPPLRPPRTPVELFKNVPRRQTRGASLSIFGLDDEPGADVRYLLQAEGSSGHALRKVVLLAVLAGLSALAFIRWRPLYQANPAIVKDATSAIAAFFANAGHQQKQSPPSVNKASVGGADLDSTQNDESRNQEGKNDLRENGLRKDDLNKNDLQKDALQKNAQSKNKDASPAVTAAQQPKTSGLELAGITSNAGAGQPAKGSAAAVETAKPHAAQANVSNVAAAARRQPSPALVRAQQYLQGKGVRQNCEQGLVYLRVAARGNDPEAAVQMGALYSSGHCVRLDRVMAYRWFTSAREQEPENRWIQQNLDLLWARMTSQERQQIVN